MERTSQDFEGFLRFFHGCNLVLVRCDDGTQENDKLCFLRNLLRTTESGAYERYFAKPWRGFNRFLPIVCHQATNDDHLTTLGTHDIVRFANRTMRQWQCQIIG